VGPLFDKESLDGGWAGAIVIGIACLIERHSCTRVSHYRSTSTHTLEPTYSRNLSPPTLIASQCLRTLNPTTLASKSAQLSCSHLCAYRRYSIAALTPPPRCAAIAVPNDSFALDLLMIVHASTSASSSPQPPKLPALATIRSGCPLQRYAGLGRYNRRPQHHLAVTTAAKAITPRCRQERDLANLRTIRVYVRS
jgi:hypothetical protein